MTRSLYDNLIGYARTRIAAQVRGADRLRVSVAFMKCERRHFAKLGRRYFVTPA